MCGIAGIWSFKNTVALGSIQRFTDAISHRGPDGSGYVLLNENKLAFGHRRLSILDLSEAGKQPMQWQGRYTVTYNGEVYNFIEIRKELEQLGQCFKSNSDTEVVLAAFQTWGKACFNRFNGMWALAIYDNESKKLLLCRDRFGVKPLYYTFKSDDYFAFASETIAFKHLDHFELTHDENMISYAMNDPVFMEGTGRSIWKNIHQLLGGHYIEIDLSSNNIQQKRWFEIPKEHNSISYNQARAEFFELTESAVNLRLRSDVPVATALSGGLDSSSVYSMLYYLKSKRARAERIDYNNIRGFVATFEGTQQDETEYAKAAIDHWKGEAEFIKTDFDAIISNIESSTRLFNDITATPISVLGDVYKAMRNRGYVVSLDGHGADEMLYGYRSLVGMAIRQAITDLDIEYEKDLSNTYLSMFHSALRSGEEEKLSSSLLKLKHNLSIDTRIGRIKHRIKQTVRPFLPGRSDVFSLPTSITYPYLNRKGALDFPELSDKPITLNHYNGSERELAIDFYYRNIPYNMRDFDRAAMQHGIEIRMPFMDYRLVNFVFSLDMRYKVGHGYSKRIMRDAMHELLPQKVSQRTLKTGMGAPINDWFNKPLNTYLMDTVHSQKFLQNTLWDGKGLRDMVSEHCKSKNWEMQDAQSFWNVLNAHILLT